MKELHDKSVIAVKHSGKRLGAIPAVMELDVCDLGRARLADGTQVYVTWGRSLNREQQAKAIEAGMQPVWIGADDGTCELVIPDRHGTKLHSIIT